MRTLIEKEGFIYTDENDVLFVKGSIGMIVFRSEEYEASFYEGEWHYEIEEELFNKKVEMLKLQKLGNKACEVFERERENQRRLIY